MTESKRVARSLGADLFVVSAGLGLVHESDLVPNYDFTVSGVGGPLRTALDDSGESVTTWWSVLTGQSAARGSLAELVNAAPNRLMLVALPASYLRMVGDDLASVDDKAKQRLRIFTSEAGMAGAPANLRQCVLPYDDRLETLAGYDGTRAEFPQRALRHFVSALHGDKLAPREAHAAVTTALSGLKRRTIPLRQRMTDERITAMLRQNWASYAGSSTRLHRYLRDEALVACEQSRFRTLWRHVQAERQGREAMSYAP